MHHFEIWHASPQPCCGDACQFQGDEKFLNSISLLRDSAWCCDNKSPNSFLETGPWAGFKRPCDEQQTPSDDMSGFSVSGVSRLATLYLEVWLWLPLVYTQLDGLLDSRRFGKLAITWSGFGKYESCFLNYKVVADDNSYIIYHFSKVYIYIYVYMLHVDISGVVVCWRREWYCSCAIHEYKMMLRHCNLFCIIGHDAMTLMLRYYNYVPLMIFSETAVGVTAWMSNHLPKKTVVVITLPCYHITYFESVQRTLAKIARAILIHWAPDKMAAVLHTTLEVHFRRWKRLNFDGNFMEICSWGYKWQYISTGSGRQAIVGTSHLASVS